MLLTPDHSAFWPMATEQQRDKSWRELAWLVEEHLEHVARHLNFERPDAIVRVFQRFGLTPFDVKAKLPAAFDRDTLLELAALCRHLWNGRAQSISRAKMAWIMQVLVNSGCRLMTRPEVEHFDALPEKIELWRGIQTFKWTTPDEIEIWARGYSWTTLRAVAERFARNGHVVHVLAPKRLIDAYQYERDEAEAIVLRPDLLPPLTIERAGATTGTLAA